MLPKFDLISPESVELFAEAEGIVDDSSDVEDSGWALLAEDLNYRLRQLASLCAKFTKHSRRRVLTTKDVSAAAQQLRQEPLRGHSRMEAPKLYHLKERKLYARNEGVVDLVSLSLSSFHPAKLKDSLPSTSQAGIQGCGILEPSRNEAENGQPEGETGKETGAFVIEIMELFEKQKRKLHREREFLLDIGDPKIVLSGQSVVEILKLLPRLVDERPKLLLFVARLVSVLIRKLDGDWTAEGLIESTGKMLVDSLVQEPFEEWNQITCANIGRAIVGISRSFAKVDGCCARRAMGRFVKILENPKESPLAYSMSLICLQALGFTTVYEGEMDVVGCLVEHYKWNKAVFQTTTPFEPGPGTGAFASVAYVGHWRVFVEWYLYRLILLEKEWKGGREASGFTPQGYASNMGRLGILMHLSTEIFGPLKLPLSEIPWTRPLSPRPKSEERRRVWGLESLEALSVSTLPRDEAEVGVSAKPRGSTPIGGKRPGSGGGPKRRKRRVADYFDVPKRSRLEDQGFLFIFHQTDATVLKDRTIRDSAPQEVTRKTQSIWSKWMSRNGIKLKRSRRAGQNVRPWTGFLDIPTLVL